MQERSLFSHTMYLGFTNGDMGDISTVAAYTEDVYEVETAHFHYFLPAVFAPYSAGRVLASSVALLESLHERKQAATNQFG